MKITKKYKRQIIYFSLIGVGVFSYLKITKLSPQNLAQNRLPADSIISQPKAELGEVWNVQDLNNADQITRIIENGLEVRTAGSLLMKRDAHPKHHGCVKAFFKVDSSKLPTDQQVGVFSKENQKEYLAWIRFSNGDPDSTKADLEGDVRGMAIKLMNVPGAISGSQDFLLMNSKVFFIKDSDEYLDLMESVGSSVKLGFFFLTHPRDAQVILAARSMKIGNPLDLNYYSATPYKLGNSSMKFSARPCLSSRVVDPVPKNPTHNFLRENLDKAVSKTDACFDFFIQKNTDLTSMPIENPTSEWSEEKSPYIKVATIHIPTQMGVASSPNMNFCENLSFDPWHTLPEERPLGAINRVRKIAYSVISKKRHLHNGIEEVEPRDHVIFR